VVVLAAHRNGAGDDLLLFDHVGVRLGIDRGDLLAGMPTADHVSVPRGGRFNSGDGPDKDNGSSSRYADPETTIAHPASDLLVDVGISSRSA
jgi:hypothetical protein